MTVSFIDGGNLEYPKKTIDLLYVNDIIYHIVVYQVHLTMSGIRTHKFSGDYH